MNIYILPEEQPTVDPQRLAAIEQELQQLRNQGIAVSITAAQLAALEDRGFVYDFTTGAITLHPDSISPN